jgi:hypothetical protein
MQTSDGKPRTLGGCFFKLAKDQLAPQPRRAVFPTAPQPRLAWADRIPLAAALRSEAGEVQTVKITLIGRPGKTEQRGKIFVGVMRNQEAPKGLSPDMPTPPADPTNYLVFLPGKQFRKVLPSLTDNKDDRLIVEGYAAFDRQIGTMCVWAQRVTSVLTERTKRPPKDEAQDAPAQ